MKVNTFGQTNNWLNDEPVANLAPVANAGPALTYEAGETATLDASNSTDDKGITSYQWEKIAGPDVTIIDPNAMIASYTAPLVSQATLRFQVTVTDEEGETSTAEVVHTIRDTTPPIITPNDGPSEVLEGDTWIDPGAISVDTVDGTKTIYTQDNVGTTQGAYTIYYRDADSAGNEAIAVPRTINVAARPNTKPEANAGPNQTVASGELITMAGVLTDADNDNVSGIWTVHSAPAGVNVELGNTASPTMQWAAPVVNSDTNIVLAYTPYDGKEYGDPALVMITVLQFVEQAQSVLSGDITLGVPPVGSYQVRLYTNVYDTKTIVYDGSVAITQAGFSFTDVSLPVGTTVYGFALHPVHGGFPIKGVTQ